MPQITPIDNVKVKFYKGLPGKFDGYIPTISFENNNGNKSYYLTKYCISQQNNSQKHYDFGLNCSINNRVWNYSIIDPTPRFVAQETLRNKFATSCSCSSWRGFHFPNFLN